MEVLVGAAKITLTLGQALCRSVVQDLSILSDRLSLVEGVQSVMTRLDLHGCQNVIIFSKPGVHQAGLLRRMAAALRAPVNAPSFGPSVPDPMVGEAVNGKQRSQAVSVEPATDLALEGPAYSWKTRLKQMFFGSLAVASVGMAWVGLLVPGIPTVPFVILAAAMAAKSSPRFHERLKKAAIFGQMIRDWEEHRAVRPQIRIQAVVLTIVIVSITLLVAPLPPEIYVLVGTMFIITMILIWKIPVIRNETASQGTQTGLTLLLPAVA